MAVCMHVNGRMLICIIFHFELNLYTFCYVIKQSILEDGLKTRCASNSWAHAFRTIQLSSYSPGRALGMRVLNEMSPISAQSSSQQPRPRSGSTTIAYEIFDCPMYAWMYVCACVCANNEAILCVRQRWWGHILRALLFLLVLDVLILHFS